MRSHLEKLVALLEHKHAILTELVERQQRFKQFLIKPDWTRFVEYTQPQETLLNKLRQIQAAQEFLLIELAGVYDVAKIPNLKSLCRFVGSEWKQTILDLIENIKTVTAELRGLTRLGQALNQSHWRFVRQYMADGHGRPDLGCVYNANGVTHRQSIVFSRYTEHA